MAAKGIAKIGRFVEAFSKQKFWVGIDVHKKNYHMALRRCDGQVQTWVTDADPAKVAEQLLALGAPIEGIAYESGPTGFSLARTLQEKGFNVIVAAPSKIPRPATQAAKTDRLDCAKLAHFASKGLLSGIAVPTREQEAARGLRRQRADLTDAIRKAKQRIKSFLLARGIPEPDGLRNWSQAGVAALSTADLIPADRLTLDSKLRQLEFAQEERRLVDQKLAKIMAQQEHQKVMECLQSVPGVGPVVATAYRLEIFAPQRFGSAEQVASYCALAPVVRQSGASRGTGRILKHRQKRLRSLIIQATWGWIARDPSAKARYEKLRWKTGLAQKAVVAMARKLVIILWRVSIEQRPYRQAETPA